MFGSFIKTLVPFLLICLIFGLFFVPVIKLIKALINWLKRH